MAAELLSCWGEIQRELTLTELIGNGIPISPPPFLDNDDNNTTLLHALSTPDELMFVPKFEMPDVWLQHEDHYHRIFSKIPSVLIKGRSHHRPKLYPAKFGDYIMCVSLHDISKICFTNGEKTLLTDRLRCIKHVDDDGFFWACNYIKKTVVCYSEQFSLVRTINVRGNPTQVVFLNGIMIVVEDVKNSDDQLSFYELGSAEPFRAIKFPIFNMCIHNLKVCRRTNEIYVSCYRFIYVFSMQGDLLREIKLDSREMVYSFAIASDGHLLVADEGLSLWTCDGHLVHRWHIDREKEKLHIRDIAVLQGGRVAFYYYLDRPGDSYIEIFV